MFEKWDSALHFGVSYKLLELILTDLKMFADEKAKEAFVRETGYYREVNNIQKANQYACSVTEQEFFDLISRFLKERRKTVPSTDEADFVNEFIQAGNYRLKEVITWEPTHQVLRKEHGREISATKEDKTQEVITLLSQDPDMSLEEIDKNLKNYGMSLGIIDKIYILMSQRDISTIKMEHLITKKKE